jgi:predicted PurR-regulated permease PerM
MGTEDQPPTPPSPANTRRGWWPFATAVFILLIVCVLLYFNVAAILLLAFGGILLSVVLRLFARGISHLTGLGHRLSVLCVIAGLIILIGLAAWGASAPISTEVAQLVQSLPQAVHRIHQRMSQTGWGRWILSNLAMVGSPAVSGGFSHVTGAVSSTADAVIGAVAVIFIGLYVAYEPQLYSAGILDLFPASRQRRIRQVIDAVNFSLEWWIIGQAITMTVLGVLTGVGLWIIGIPLALVLGILSALLNFIPTFGAIIAFIPAAVLAAAQDPKKLVYVLILWLIAHALEGYILTPIIQRRAVLLPPAVGITSQLTLGVLVGPVGLIFAHPFAVTVMVIVKMMFVEDEMQNVADIPEPEKPNSA